MTIRKIIAIAITMATISAAPTNASACSETDRYEIDRALEIYTDTWAMAAEHLPSDAAAFAAICKPDLGQVLLDSTDLVLSYAHTGCYSVAWFAYFEESRRQALDIAHCPD